MLTINSTISGGSPRTWSVGTLVYTRAGLVSLFGWLLWGDFVFTLMEQVMPSLLPLLLKEHGASNRTIAIISGTIYMVANALLNPIISYRSDRFRSPWGRRRPFILLTTPFVVLFLAAIPFAPDILRILHTWRWGGVILEWSPVAPVILIFGLLVVGFQVFNMFVSSVYYYLIPDVVPQELLGRFYGLFRVCGFLASVVFNYFILGHADTHMRMIFVATALGYGVCIILMCLRVREGQYPPPPADEPRGRWGDGIRNYIRECYGHPYWLMVFFTYACLGWGATANMFAIFFYRDEMQFSMHLIGKMQAALGIVSALLIYPLGVLLDRWGSHRTLLVSASAGVVLMVLSFFLSVNTWSAFILRILGTVPYTMGALALMKWTVDVYPRDRYGQFASAGALFNSVGAMVLGPLAGLVMDWAGVYRYFFLWFAMWSLLAIPSLIITRRWTPASSRAGDA